jgi:hypothetical protein
VVDELLDERGQVIGIASNAAKLNDPTIDLLAERFLAAFRNGAIVLPAEPVGAGARWRQTSDATARLGVPVFEVKELTLSQTSATDREFTWTGSFTKNPDGIFGGLPASLQAHLESVSGTVTGRSTLDLSRPGSASDVRTDLKVTFSYLENGKRRTARWTIQGRETRTAE